MTRPKVSVGIPCYRAGHYLAAAVESVLAQTDCDVTVAILNDASPDHTAKVARSFADRGVVYLEHDRNKGIAAARNSMLAQLKGDFVAFLDADDLWVPGALQAALAALAQNPDIDMVFGGIEVFLCPEISQDRRDRLRLPQKQAKPPRLSGNMVARRTVLDTVGPFDETQKVGEFIDWALRAQDMGFKHAFFDAPMLRRRIHGENFTLRNKDDAAGYATMIKRTLDRRRQSE